MSVLKDRTGQYRYVAAVLQFLLAAFAAVQMFPLVWLVLSSFKNNLEITGANVIGFPRQWRWDNYRYVLDATRLGSNLLNSLLYSIATVVLSGILASMVSYAVTRMKWKGSGFVLALFMTGLMIPVHATLLPVFIMMKEARLLNTPLALVIPYTVNALPSTIFIMAGFFASLPREMEESGVIDGCNIYAVFWHIILPLLKPAIVTTAVFTFLGAWNELMFANTLVNKENLMTVTVAINSLRGIHFTEYGAIFAGLALATFPPVLVYALFSDQVQKSMIAGAIKG